MKRITLIIALIATLTTAKAYHITSLDGALTVEVTDQPTLQYSVCFRGLTALEASPLGIFRDDRDGTQPQHIAQTLPLRRATTAYETDRGKQSHVSQDYVEQEFVVEEGGYSIVFRVYNRGLAFAYKLAESGTVRVFGEQSAFTFPEGTRAFLTQLAKAKSGWEQTNPSYEDPYHVDVPLDELSEHRQGWIFPALFHTDKLWMLVSETAVTPNYVACHLTEAIGRTFQVAFPPADHNLAANPAWAEMTTPALTPWRTIVVSDQLADVVESTLADDLVEPSTADSSAFKPGKASWSWLYYADSWTTYEGTRRYIDLAATLHFNYCLVDALWDTQIGRDRIAELARYARSKNVALLLWYNSNGNWNTAPQTPKDLMNTREARRQEMQWLSSIGVAGIKVDFFGGDKQASLQLYHDILTDAEEFGLVVNFHGATLPRGWSRMYPALLNMEAVMGQEFCRGDQQNENRRPSHATILPFTRNAVAPMDFTPVVLDQRLGSDEGCSRRVTTAAFELALPVLFFHPLAHFGLTPDDLNRVPQFVVDYLSQVPTVWDETRLLDGYPGRHVVVARRSQTTWYVAGINGQSQNQQIDLDLSFLKGKKKATLITGSKSGRNQVERQEINLKRQQTISLQLAEADGFIIIAR